jgi:uncharacterized protein YqjF (DUF2071 family)
MTLQEFEQLLKAHDWTYNYSDDHRAWDKGREQAKQIDKARKLLAEKGLKEEADKLHNKYSPFN